MMMRLVYFVIGLSDTFIQVVGDQVNAARQAFDDPARGLHHL